MMSQFVAFRSHTFQVPPNVLPRMADCDPVLTGSGVTAAAKKGLSAGLAEENMPTTQELLYRGHWSAFVETQITGDLARSISQLGIAAMALLKSHHTQR
jgi:hypothetical protein